MRWISVAFFLLAPCAALAADANAVAGREDFLKFRCNQCHSVYGEKTAAQVPLRDLSREKPETIAAMILARTHLAPEALFDEMAMSAMASNLTAGELLDIVAYLRNPSAAAQKSQKKNR